MVLFPSKGSWELEILCRYFFKVLIPSGVLLGWLVKIIGHLYKALPAMRHFLQMGGSWNRP